MSAILITLAIIVGTIIAVSATLALAMVGLLRWLEFALEVSDARGVVFGASVFMTPIVIILSTIIGIGIALQIGVI